MLAWLVSFASVTLRPAYTVNPDRNQTLIRTTLKFCVNPYIDISIDHLMHM
jgi:hypothetical protein